MELSVIRSETGNLADSVIDIGATETEVSCDTPQIARSRHSVPRRTQAIKKNNKCKYYLVLVVVNIISLITLICVGIFLAPSISEISNTLIF